MKLICPDCGLSLEGEIRHYCANAVQPGSECERPKGGVEGLSLGTTRSVPVEWFRAHLEALQHEMHLASLDSSGSKFGQFADRLAGITEALQYIEKRDDSRSSGVDVPEYTPLREAANFALGALESLQPEGLAVQKLRKALIDGA